MSTQPMAQTITRPSWRKRLTMQVWRRRMVVTTYLALASVFVFMPLVNSWKLNPLVGWTVSAVLVLVAIAGFTAEWFWLSSRANWWGLFKPNRKREKWKAMMERGATVQEIEAALMRGDDVDERQRAVLDRAYRYAYWLLAVLGGVALLYGLTGSTLIPKDTRFVLFFTIVITLPTAVVAWSEPDPPGEN